MTLRNFLLNNNPANLVIAAFLAFFCNMVMRVGINGTIGIFMLATHLTFCLSQNAYFCPDNKNKPAG